AMWPSAYPADTVLDVFTYAGSPGTYSLALGAGAGLWWKNGNWSVSANYVAANGDVANTGTGASTGSNDSCTTGGGIGTDCSAETFTAQIGYAGSNWGAAVAYQYMNGYGQFPGGSVTGAFTPFALEALSYATSSNSVALSAYWQPSQSGWVPSISAGWGITGLSFGNHNSLEDFDTPFDSAQIQSWYVGLQWADAFIKGNTLGMGVGQAPFVTRASFRSVDGTDFNGNSFTPQDGNYAWEWWYKFQVTDNISVTPAIFYLSNPLGQAGYSYQQATGGDTGSAALTNFGGLIKTTFKF
ncbi:MAG: carbohydrate porin, partial [Cyanobium sp.]